MERRIDTRTVVRTGYVTAALLIVAAGATGNFPRLGTAVLCAAAVLIVLGAIWLAIPRSLGFGDVRLATVAALMLGWWSPLLVILAVLAAQVACLATVAVLAATRRLHRRTAIPFGTFIVLSSIGIVLAVGR